MSPLGSLIIWSQNFNTLCTTTLYHIGKIDNLECLKHFPIDTIVLIIDFAENYNFEVQNEMQSMH